MNKNYNIPLVDLKRQYDSIKTEINQSILNVLEQSCFILGEPVTMFEQAFAKVCAVGFGVGTSSGTSALHLALIALGVGLQDEVITTANTFIATTEAISQAGAKIVFADIDEKTYNLDPKSFQDKITPRTKAVVVVHLFGQSADMDEICRIAQENSIVVIEDASQAHLAEFQGRKVGSFGACACFSFYPGKNLGAYGDAGIVVTNQESLADNMRMLSNHGRINKYEHLIEGYNYRLDTLQAAILNVKLKYLDQWTRERRQIAHIYDIMLKNYDVVTPYVDERAQHVYHLYVIRLKNRERVIKALSASDIASGIHYPLPLHLQKAYEHLGYKKDDLPVTEKCCNEILSLPLFPELTLTEISRIVNCVRQECFHPTAVGVM